MASNNSIETGWYEIDGTWRLYVDGDDGRRELKRVNVDTLRIDPADELGQYTVVHYGPGGEHITTLSLDADDIGTVLGSRTPVEPPAYANGGGI